MLLRFTKTKYCLSSKLHFRPHVVSSSQKVLSSSFTNFLKENLSDKRSSKAETSESKKNNLAERSNGGQNLTKKTNQTKPFAEPLNYNELQRNKPLSQTLDLSFRQKRKTKKPFRNDEWPKSVYFQVSWIKKRIKFTLGNELIPRFQFKCISSGLEYKRKTNILFIGNICICMDSEISS